MKYNGTKIYCREDAKGLTSHVHIGYSISGEAYISNHDLGKYELQEVLVPKVNEMIKILGDRFDKVIRTSLVTSFYIFGNEEDGPDKFIKPSWCPMDVFSKIQPKNGDVLVQTLNSIYFFQLV